MDVPPESEVSSRPKTLAFWRLPPGRIICSTCLILAFLQQRTSLPNGRFSLHLVRIWFIAPDFFTPFFLHSLKHSDRSISNVRFLTRWPLCAITQCFHEPIDVVYNHRVFMVMVFMFSFAICMSNPSAEMICGRWLDDTDYQIEGRGLQQKIERPFLNKERTMSKF